MEESNVKQTELKPGETITIDGVDCEVTSVKMDDDGGKTVVLKPVKPAPAEK